ncbi:MAG: hypothetical protein IBX72_15060 [Nitrospirae bacterium]|nr:hypothetical protein [Nitrospirota bacterium]
MNKPVVCALVGIFAIILFSNSTVSASWSVEAGELSYQVNHSDRIVTGTVDTISPGFDYTDVVINVDDWLNNQLPGNKITVRTERGTNAFTAGAANFSAGEKVLLMLNDDDVEKGRFKMAFMELGKHPVSDRDAVIKAITEQEKATAVGIARNNPKVKESLPTDAEVIAVEIPSFAGRNDKIYNVIFKNREFHDIITVNLTSGIVENSVSIRGEYQPEVEELPMPVFREDVIVYFKEMPASLEEFASRYGGKLIFAKLDIKMAAFETVPIGSPAQTSQRTLDFINEVSKDSLVEKAYRDEFEFTRPDEKYSPEPGIKYPEDMKDDYVPNKVIVGFWRRPPSLEDFASKHGGKLIYYEEVLMFASFDVSNISGFISKASTDPYVRYVHPDGIGSIFESTSGDVGNISEEADASKAPGFEAILAGLLFSLIYMMKRGRTNG